jgi:hypothetical protein
VKALSGLAALAALVASALVITPAIASVSTGTPVAPGASVCPGAAGGPGDVAVLNLTPVEATGHGFGAVRASDAPSNNSLGAQAVSNVNFRPGSVDPNVAFASIGTDRRVCFDNSPHATIHLVADQMGVMPASAYEPAATTGATRLVDTRSGAAMAPGATVCAVAVGAPGRIAVVNITPVEATGPGFAAVRASDAPSNNTLGEAAVSNANFSVGSVDPNLAFSEIGVDGRICFDNSPHSTIHLVVDQMGSVPADAFVPAAASGATRLMDTRRGLVVGGIGVSSVAPGAAVCAQAVGDPGDVAVVNGTPVEATAAGFMAVRSSSAPSNNTLGTDAVSNWNFRPGSIDPNVAFAEIGPDGMICVDNSNHATVQMVLDQAGYVPAGQLTPAASTGAARIVDTRRGFVAEPAAVPPPTTTSTTTTTTTTPPGATVPGPPHGLAAVAGPGTVTLNWSPPTVDGGATVDKYLIERSVLGSGLWAEVGFSTNTSFADTHLAASIDYLYRISAHNSIGWGAASDPVAGRAAQAVAPGEVRQLDASSDASQVTLDWLPPLDDGGAPVTHYEIRRALNCNPANSLGLKDVTGTTYTDSGLATGTTYCYSVVAANAAGDSKSVTVEVRVGHATTPAPCPMVAYSTPVQNGSVDWTIELRWNTPSDPGVSPITQFAVSWYRGPSATFVRTDVVPATARVAWLDQADAGTTYDATVRAVTSAGLGVACYSNQVATS